MGCHSALRQNQFEMFGVCRRSDHLLWSVSKWLHLREAETTLPSQTCQRLNTKAGEYCACVVWRCLLFLLHLYTAPWLAVVVVACSFSLARQHTGHDSGYSRFDTLLR